MKRSSNLIKACVFFITECFYFQRMVTISTGKLGPRAMFRAAEELQKERGCVWNLYMEVRLVMETPRNRFLAMSMGVQVCLFIDRPEEMMMMISERKP